MKTIKNIVFCFMLLFVASSCNDWLTVEPKTLSTKDKMFSTEMGYKTTLTGLYLELRTLYTPGTFLMGGTGVDVMAHLYPDFSKNYGIESVGNLLYTHQYSGTSLEMPLNTLFQSLYRIIANANILLDALSEQQVMSPDMSKLIEAEALAIRAFCHSELLRLWGPVPTNINETERYLPYVKEYTIDKYEYDSYEVFVQKIMDDLNNSIMLLEQVDPILHFTNAQLNSSYVTIEELSDAFLLNRQKRFNIYGVKALKARMALYVGDREQAYQLAKEVVEATNDDGTTKFSLGTVNDLSSMNSYDYLFSKEHLVGLDIEAFVANQFTGRTPTFVSTEALIKERLYENQSDTRLRMFATTWMYSYYAYSTMKYSYLTEWDFGYKSIPLIRLSEMYLVLIETAPIAEANVYYRTFRESRAASYVPLTENTRNIEVLKEYIREFFSEGQSFFVHKRMNLSSLYMSGEPINADQYRLPLPTQEINY